MCNFEVTSISSQSVILKEHKQHGLKLCIKSFEISFKDGQEMICW